jgi:hypothetical protein
MRAIAGAIVAASGALLHGMTERAESAVRVAEYQTGKGPHVGFGNNGYQLAAILVVAGLIIVAVDLGIALLKGKGKAD